METLTRDQILERGRPKWATVEIEALGGSVCVRSWTLRVKQAWREKLRSEDYPERASAIPWAIAQCLYDRPDGQRLFTTDADVDLIASLTAEVVERLFEKIALFSDADAEAVKRAGEPSAETSSSDSPSESPSLSA